MFNFMLHFFTADVVYVSHARNAIYRNRKVIAFCIFYTFVDRKRKENRTEKWEKKNWKIIFVFKLLCAENEYCILHSTGENQFRINLAQTEWTSSNSGRELKIQKQIHFSLHREKSTTGTKLEKMQLTNVLCASLRLAMNEWSLECLCALYLEYPVLDCKCLCVYVCARLINLLYIWTVLFSAQKRFESNTSPRMQFIYLFIFCCCCVPLSLRLMHVKNDDAQT